MICPNLEEVRHVIVRDHVWNPPNQISGWTIQFLFGHLNLISGLS